jgi:RimJ/RimL family protein N-acetyltransferase
MVPIIETERLILRGHRIEDFNDCAAIWSMPEVVRYIGGKPLTSEDVWARLLRYAGHWQWMGFGFWAVEEKATGAFVGDAGFAEFKREIEPSVLGVPESGWVLAPHAQGKGYATEAVRAVIAWGDRHFGAARTVCLIHPENLRSLRVAEKCGYKEFQRTTYKTQPTIILERPLPDGRVSDGIIRLQSEP